jgi:hypothetical protein
MYNIHPQNTSKASTLSFMIDGIAWKELKNSRLHFKYFKEVIPTVKSCLELELENRLDFPKDLL